MNILVLSLSMKIGGIEKSLLDFLRACVDNNYNVDLFLVNRFGELLDDVPKEVNIIGLNNKTEDQTKQPLFKTFLRKSAKVIAKALGVFNKLKIKEIRNYISEYKFEKKYDIAIAFHGANEVVNFACLEKVNAKQKIMFYHADYTKNKNAIIEKNMKKFDKVVFVSKSCMHSAIKLVPELKSSADYLYNLVDVNGIIEKSTAISNPFDKSKFNIVSVGRLSKEKGFLRGLKVFKKLLKTNSDVCWNICGNGQEMEKIQKYIIKNNMVDSVKLWGAQKNPYPFIKNANLFLLPSYQEAAPIVYAEAMILKVPVLTTKVLSSAELVGDYGFECENSFNGLYNSLKYIINNRKIVETKKRNLEKYQYNNDEIKNKIKQIIEAK